jgi:hypothetical protein
MRTHRFVIGLVLGIGLAIAAGNVEAKDKPFHASFAGTIINKDDFSFTGTPGSYATVSGKSTLGPFTAQSVYEVAPDDNTCTLPGGGSGVEFVVAGEGDVTTGWLHANRIGDAQRTARAMEARGAQVSLAACS